MSEEANPSRPAMEKLVEMLADARAGDTSKLGSADFTETLRQCFAEIVAAVKAGSKTELDEAEVDDQVRQQLVRIRAMVSGGKLTIEAGADVEAVLLSLAKFFADKARRTGEVLEWLAFVERLTQRQGTRTPDWASFYAERGELDRRIRERGEN